MCAVELNKWMGNFILKKKKCISIPITWNFSIGNFLWFSMGNFLWFWKRISSIYKKMHFDGTGTVHPRINRRITKDSVELNYCSNSKIFMQHIRLIHKFFPQKIFGRSARFLDFSNFFCFFFLEISAV